ncbi:putative receptor protein kinase ZmPK1 [Tripterygium wilfordii]|uniref:putative receptor protein kinase ZmPK1 n=1 Tax=Tripterygium wilfordii TaxID=458696 RepID=UPI0018F83FE6|nr:putative receptor protein kinase ZmPK1 [Tripterygium wilfordii]
MMLRTKICSCLLSLLFHAFLVFFSSAASSTQNYLPRGSSLSVEDESDLLTSPDKAFTCGFYGLGENAYWFSIWFTHSTDKTVVWTANRDRPVNSKGSRVSLLRDGAMVLTDVDGSLIWQTNTTSTHARRAELLDTGNLVVKDPNGKILWQSFDFPTDTLLPYQRLTKSTKLISSLRIGTFLSGYFSLFFDNDNVLKMIYDGPDISSLYWPPPYNNVYQNGRFDYNSSRVAFFDEMGTFVSSDRLEFSASDVGFGIKRRLTVDYDGNLRVYSLNNLTGLWAISWQALSQACNVHGVCGRNAICIYTPVPKCSCPPGYEVAEPGDWNKGCKAMFNQTCSPSQEKFVQLPQVDYYGFDLNYTTSTSLFDCRKLCLEDCRCVAFSYRLSGEGLCYTKGSLFNGFKSPNFPGSIYLRMPVSVETSTVFAGTNSTCPLAEAEIVMGSPDMYNIGKSMRWRYLYSFAAALGAIEILFVVAGFLLLFGRRGSPASREDGYRVMSSQFRKFGYDELKKATKNFKEELGRGGSGAVYKGSLADERVVAVKRLGGSYQGEEVFWTEVSTIGKLNHMNLVRMWGFCAEGRHRLLVYEYVENLSLDKHLFALNFLGWKERFKVALGTAKGLAYLHHECLEWIIHCDVKPENILLDGDFEAKIADFGLAKLSLRDKMKSEFSQIRGTKGYMAPEWALNLPITAKADVYSYGVVILEMVKGIRLSNWVADDLGEQETELTRFVRVVGRKIQCREDSWMDDAMDPRLMDGGCYGSKIVLQAKKMVELGILCVQEDRSKRPTMAYVAQALLECEDELCHSGLSSHQ